MKEGIHPDYHTIKIMMVDGTEFETRSTWGKEGDVLKLDVDPTTHPAWTGGSARVIEKAQLSRFQSRYGKFGIANESNEQKEEAAKKESAEK